MALPIPLPSSNRVVLWASQNGLWQIIRVDFPQTGERSYLMVEYCGDRFCLTDYPMRYEHKSDYIVYDYPELVPKYVKAKVRRYV